MHVLLPPSETKTRGGRGRPLRGRIGGPLATARTQVISALLDLLAGDPAAAIAALLVPPGLAADALAANARVLDAPTTPALRRYTGTVYEGLDVGSLSAAQQRLAGRSVVVFSGLFGAVRGDEAVPSYRVPAKAVLPNLGVAATFWRPVLDEHLPALVPEGLIVDLRSSDYAAMWRPRAATAPRVVTVRILSPLPRGGYGVISYPSKFAKGRLARELVRRAAAGRPTSGPDDVLDAWADCGGSHGVRTRTGLDLYAVAPPFDRTTSDPDAGHPS